MSEKDFTSIFHKHLGVNDSLDAPKKLMEVMLDKPRREELFRNMLWDWDKNLDYDWFHKYFQDEQAERKKKKQDFTPMELTDLLNRLTNVGLKDSEAFKEGVYTTYDVASGTGGILINAWYNDRTKDGFIKYNPLNYMYYADEISARTIPFLLFNLSIRGMNAVVFYGDTISRKGFNIFYLENVHDSYTAFSNVNVMPRNEHVEKYFAVKFVNKLPQDKAERKIYEPLNENGIDHLIYRLDTTGAKII